MSIITISAGFYSGGKRVAEAVAEKLGYRCLARELILEIPRDFNVPVIGLIRAMHDASSDREKLTRQKQKYIAYFRAALLKQFRQNNLVYYGLAGHFFAKGVTHALKVRILADTRECVNLVMEQDKVSREEAVCVFEKEDEERRKWGRSLYGIDITDPGLYSMVICTEKLTVDDAADLIVKAVGSGQFDTSRQSQKVLEDLALAAEVKMALFEINPDAGVRADNGFVHLAVGLPSVHWNGGKRLVDEMKKVASRIPGVRGIDVEVFQTDKENPCFCQPWSGNELARQM